MTEQENKFKDMDSIIIHYLDKNITDEELEKFSEWLNINEENKQTFREIRNLHLGLKSSYQKDEEIWHNFSKKIEKSRVQSFFRQTLKYVAVILLSVGVSFGVFMNFRKHATPKIFACNSYGLPVTMTLSDGTFVKLGSNSSLTYASDFNDDNRNVTLQGEGFFVVAKNKKIPFIVTSGQNEITVTGTKFEINARDQNLFTATLLEGGICFHNKHSNKSMTLTPGRKLEYDDLSKRISLSISHATLDDYMADEHTFYSESLSSILERMGNIYGVEFTCNNPYLLNKRYRSVFNDGETLDSFLEVIKSLTGLNYEKVDQYSIKLYQ